MQTIKVLSDYRYNYKRSSLIWSDQQPQDSTAYILLDAQCMCGANVMQVARNTSDESCCGCKT